MIIAEKKQEIIKEFARTEGDTGSPEVQIALLTKRITKLTAHMIANKHDYSSKRGMDILIARRKNLLSYLKATDLQRYLDLTQKLGLKAN